jgi:hypothetical protein
MKKAIDVLMPAHAALADLADPPRPAATHTGWISPDDEMPDDETLVLLRVDDDEYPVNMGFHESDGWRFTSADLIEEDVLGWMHLHDAAAVPDWFDARGGAR